MLRKEILRQTKHLLKQKEAMITLILLFWLVIYNFLRNVLYFQGMDVSGMYQSMKLLTLSYNMTNYNADITLLLVMIYPLLAALPAGFAYVKEQQTKEEVFLITRLGKKAYMLSKLGAAFLTTAVVFAIPFLTEIVLNCISFPLRAQRDLTNFAIYRPEYAEMVHNYLGSQIYIFSPFLYAIVCTLLFALISGILGMFTVSVSYAISVKFRVLLLLPVFLLLNGTAYFNGLVPRGGVQVSWHAYMLMFGESKTSVWYLAGGIAVIAALTACFYLLGKKRERW